MNEHQLSIKADGHWQCSCGRWGSQLLGPLTDHYSITWGITEETVRKWHRSHANAIIIDIDTGVSS